MKHHDLVSLMKQSRERQQGAPASKQATTPLHTDKHQTHEIAYLCQEIRVVLFKIDKSCFHKTARGRRPEKK